MVLARPVLPLPGMPLMAISKRASSAVEQKLAVAVSFCHEGGFHGGRVSEFGRLLTPGLVDKVLYLLIHG